MDYELVLFEQRMEAEQAERLASYKRHYEYYLGGHKQPLPVRTGQPNDNVILNLARIVVDKGAAFLFGKDLVWELQEGESTPAEDALDTVWKRNRRMTFLAEIGTSGGIYGHVFIKILPDGIAPGIPRLVNILPELVTVLRDYDDLQAVNGYRIEWTGIDTSGRPLHKRQDIVREETRWIVRNRVDKGNGAWAQGPQAPADFVWPWPWAPIVDAPNIILPGSYYGQSDLADLDEQDAVNYVASKIQRILRYHAHPKTWGKGFKAGDLQIREDDMLIIPSPDGSLGNLEMQSDLSSSLDFLDKLVNSYMASARVPRLDPAVINVGALSGFALKVLYGDLLEKTELKRRTYGDLLIEINRRLCDMLGFGAENYVTIHWPDPLPVDENAEMTRDKFELEAELASIETVQRRRGLDPEVEAERKAKQEAETNSIGGTLIRQFMAGAGTGTRRPGQQEQDPAEAVT